MGSKDSENQLHWIKLEIFIPQTHLEVLEDALHNAGAGVIGEYDHCFAVSEVTGSFRPSSLADPFIGQQDEITHVQENKLEVNCPRGILSSVIQAIRQVHPYEEPVINIIPLMSID